MPSNTAHDGTGLDQQKTARSFERLRPSCAMDFDLAKAELRPLAEKVWRHCEAHDITGKTVTVKIKYSDFSQATRSRTVSGAVSDIDMTLEIAETLLASVFPLRRPVRLLGITLSSLNAEESEQEPQLTLGP